MGLQKRTCYGMALDTGKHAMPEDLPSRISPPFSAGLASLSGTCSLGADLWWLQAHLLRLGNPWWGVGRAGGQGGGVLLCSSAHSCCKYCDELSLAKLLDHVPTCEPITGQGNGMF